MQIARLIKTTWTKLGRKDCATSRKNICENTKRSQANREAKIYRFISHIKYLRPFVPFPVTFQCQITCREEVLYWWSAFCHYFSVLYMHTALARTRWSPHSGFWLIVLRGTKQLYFHFIGLFSETISGQRCTVLDQKEKKQRKPRYSYGLNWRDKQRSFLGKAYGLNWRDKQRCAVKWLFWEKFFLKFVFSECNFTCVFICFFICQSTFFILLIFSAEYFSRF